MRQLGTTRRRRGAVMVYAVISLVALVAFCMLAVDWGHVQAVKTDLKRGADATARGHLALYASSNNLATAQFFGPFLATAQFNPTDPGSGVTPTATITWGWWDANTKTFSSGGGSPTAVQVTLSRTAANNNAVPVVWGRLFGRRTCDVSATSVALLTSQQSTTVNVSAQSDPWLAGMPAGSGASYSDTAPGQSPKQVTAIPVTPGSYLTITNVSGAINHGPSLALDDAKGSAIYSHGIDSPGGPTPAAENGIADVVMPIDALLGVFLDSNRPDLSAAPTRRDYSTASSRDMSSYDDLELKQPFYVGDGQTSGGAVQQFRVPAGATRLYLGVMDGYEWKNNSGSFTATLTVTSTVSIVQ